jgi:tetraacyldisaccharide 4'-kinase
VPVVSVGALRAGGSGKTPVAALLARRLATERLRVGVVAGAYRGTERRRTQLVAPSLRWCPGAWRRVGDEALLLASWLGGVALVVCGADKLGAARAAVALGAQIVVVDDGFQHLRLARDLDVLLDDGEPLRPLPAGDGREGRAAAAASDLRWLHLRGGEAAPAPHGGCELWSRNRAAALYLVRDGSSVGEAATLRDRRVCLLAGIARPRSFVELVRALGAQLVGSIFVADHRGFGARQLRAAARSGAEVVLCTEKDAVRLVGSRAAPRDMLALGCSVELGAGEALLERALDPLAQRAATC